MSQPTKKLTKSVLRELIREVIEETDGYNKLTKQSGEIPHN
jgi:hypothetical protein